MLQFIKFRARERENEIFWKMCRMILDRNNDFGRFNSKKPSQVRIKDYRLPTQYPEVSAHLAGENIGRIRFHI